MLKQLDLKGQDARRMHGLWLCSLFSRFPFKALANLNSSRHGAEVKKLVENG